MPELPEIEVLRRSLEPLLPGDRIERVEVHSPMLREPIPGRRLQTVLPGKRITSLGRRAKYLLIGVEGGHLLAVHLGMSGRLTLVPERTPREEHEHVAFRLASGRRLRLRDPRRFGLVLLLEADGYEDDRHFRHLGLEPLGGALDGDRLAELARGRRGPVKSFLMDAERIVGVGNIYACEALHRAGIHPNRSVARISSERWQRLADAVIGVLSDAIAEGGTTLNDFADGRGESGYFQVSLAVYGREGEGCERCGRTIRRMVHANRSTFYCPGCQR